MAGLAAGRKLVENPAKIVSVTVSYKNEAYVKKVEDLANEVLKKIDSPCG